VPRAAEQRTRATQVARDGIQQLLDAGISFKRIAEAYAATAVQLVLEHADIDDAKDLLVSLHIMLDKHTETQSHGPAGR
jgi:hypothetical protein